MLKTTRLPDKLAPSGNNGSKSASSRNNNSRPVFKRNNGNGKVNRFSVSENSMKHAKKSEKLSKSENLSKLGQLKSENLSKS